MMKRKTIKTSYKHFLFLILIFVFILSACQGFPEDLFESNPSKPETLNEGNYQQGKVTYVIDGDTFDVEFDDGETVRVRPILVDAPEICHASSDAECEPEPFGEEAHAYTKDLLEGQTVYLEQDVSTRDPYDRMLFYVYLEDGQMFQELILAEGLAEVAVFEPDVKYQSHLERVEQEAKDQGINMWSN